MSVPKHLWRFPTSEARESLASRLGITYTSEMQDWEWEVSDSARISEFMGIYKSNKLTDDESFSLMEVIVQSFADLDKDLSENKLWQETLKIISGRLDTHIYTVWYWSSFDATHEFYVVSRHLKEIREASRKKYA